MLPGLLFSGSLLDLSDRRLGHYGKHTVLRVPHTPDAVSGCRGANRIERNRIKEKWYHSGYQNKWGWGMSNQNDKDRPILEALRSIRLEPREVNYILSLCNGDVRCAVGLALTLLHERMMKREVKLNADAIAEASERMRETIFPASPGLAPGIPSDPSKGPQPPRP